MSSCDCAFVAGACQSGKTPSRCAGKAVWCKRCAMHVRRAKGFGVRVLPRSGHSKAKANRDKTRKGHSLVSESIRRFACGQRCENAPHVLTALAGWASVKSVGISAACSCSACPQAPSGGLSDCEVPRVCYFMLCRQRWRCLLQAIFRGGSVRSACAWRRSLLASVGRGLAAGGGIGRLCQPCACAA